jgi:hypothetical protein
LSGYAAKGLGSLFGSAVSAAAMAARILLLSLICIPFEQDHRKGQESCAGIRYPAQLPMAACSFRGPPGCFFFSDTTERRENHHVETV